MSYLSNGPFDHRATGQTGPVHLLKVVVRIVEEFGFHLITDVIPVV